MTVDARLPAIVAALRKRGDAYAPLVEALCDDMHPSDCLTCQGSTYSLHEWSALPDGALVGPVWKALHAIRRNYEGELVFQSDIPQKAEYEAVSNAIIVVRSAMNEENINAAVCDALETWLGLKTEARDAKV